MDAFEKLDVWRRSARLCVDLYRQLLTCRDRAFRDQINRSALSVPSNIAEGYERGSTREFIRFLKIAKGSCGELRTQLYIGKETGLIDAGIFSRLLQEAIAISKMIQGLIRSLNRVS